MLRLLQRHPGENPSTPPSNGTGDASDTRPEQAEKAFCGEGKDNPEEKVYTHSHNFCTTAECIPVVQQVKRPQNTLEVSGL